MIDDMKFPEYLSPNHRVFKNANHYRIVIRALTRALIKQGRPNKYEAKSNPDSALFDGVIVEFSVKCHWMEVFLDHLNNKIVLIAPKTPGEKLSSLKERAIKYQKEFLPSLETLRTRGLTEIYLTLEDRGRKKLSKEKI